jgi:hypothetical protein
MKWTLALALTMVVVALPAQAADRADAESMTIRLLSVTTSTKYLVDRPPKRVSNVGDVVWFKSTLRNERPQFEKPKGAIVGSDVATVKLVTRSAVDIKLVVTLPGGTLRAAGRIRETDATQTLRVTGGTGTFANARGTGVTRPLNTAGSRALNVYRVALP